MVLMKLKCWLSTCALLAGVAVSLNSCTSGPGATSPPAASTSVAAAALPPGTIRLNAQMEQRAGIRLAMATRRVLADKTLFSSTVEATAGGSGLVIAPLPGIITRVVADIGQSVRRGQIVAYINSPVLAETQSTYLVSGAKIQEAQAQVQLVSGRVALAKAEVERESTLYKKGISSLRDLQTAEVKLSSIQSELAAARSMAAAARTLQDATRARLVAMGAGTGATVTTELPLRSPLSGVITQKAVQPGQSVGPTSESLFTIVDLSRVSVMLEVPQGEVASIKLGAPVQFTSEVAPGQTFRGQVSRLGENFDPQSRTVSVRVTIANSRGTLKPGMLVLAQAVSGNTRQVVLSIPNAAIQQVDGKDVVFVKKAGVYRMRPVQLGERNGQYTEVTAGLTDDETVVTEGSFILKAEALKATLGADS